MIRGTLASIHRFVCADSLSLEALGIASVRLNDFAGHEDCGPLPNRVLPTKLNDVSGPKSPILLDSAAQSGQQIVLSHCWASLA